MVKSNGSALSHSTMTDTKPLVDSFCWAWASFCRAWHRITNIQNSIDGPYVEWSAFPFRRGIEYTTGPTGKLGNYYSSSFVIYKFNFIQRPNHPDRSPALVLLPHHLLKLHPAQWPHLDSNHVWRPCHQTTTPAPCRRFATYPGRFLDVCTTNSSPVTSQRHSRCNRVISKVLCIPRS